MVVGRTPLKKCEDQQHPVEVIGRLRQQNCSVSSIQSADNGVRLRVDSGHLRDFALDGVSWGGEPLQQFYSKHIDGRVAAVRYGGKCTIIMYGATGSGKSYTMFGSVKEQGVAYRALARIMEHTGREAEAEEGEEGFLSSGGVRAKVIEIYNEEIYDLLSDHISKGPFVSPQRTKLAVRDRKVKNASCINGKKVEEITEKLQAVEKRRVVKSTSYNERSSRSHCMIIVDVPSSGGRLVLVDMAGSENLDQTGICTEAKMQTCKINQGNAALKRVVEAIANGDSHIPYRDSKLTMLLQDSFEDDKSKILMILCASTDPKDIHKTISTLEYGAKAKCIVKLPKSPPKEKFSSSDNMILETRINVLTALLSKLEADKKLKDECKNELEKELKTKAEQVEELKNKISRLEKEKLQMMVNMIKMEERILGFVQRIERRENKMREVGTRRSAQLPELKIKIDEIVGKVESIEAEFMGNNEDSQIAVESSLSHDFHHSKDKLMGIMEEDREVPAEFCLSRSLHNTNTEAMCNRKEDIEVAPESSLSHYLHTTNTESCPTSVSKNSADKETSFTFFNRSDNEKQIASRHLQVSLPISSDSSYDQSQISTDSNSLGRSFHDIPCKTEISDMHESNTITDVDGEPCKTNSLRDWDEEIQFTLVCNDSEPQAVICRSCDQVEEFPTVSDDIDSEDPEFTAQLCSSTDLQIMDVEGQNPNKRKAIRFFEDPTSVHEYNKDSLKTEKSCKYGDTDTIKNEANLMVEAKSSTCPSINVLEMHQVTATESLFTDGIDRISCRGWLPTIPESSLEGQDSETSSQASEEENRVVCNNKIIDEDIPNAKDPKISEHEVDNSIALGHSSSDSIINDFLRLNGRKSTSISLCSDTMETSTLDVVQNKSKEKETGVTEIHCSHSKNDATIEDAKNELEHFGLGKMVDCETKDTSSESGHEFISNTSYVWEANKKLKKIWQELNKEHRYGSEMDCNELNFSIESLPCFFGEDSVDGEKYPNGTIIEFSNPKQYEKKDGQSSTSHISSTDVTPSNVHVSDVTLQDTDDICNEINGFSEEGMNGPSSQVSQEVELSGGSTSSSSRNSTENVQIQSSKIELPTLSCLDSIVEKTVILPTQVNSSVDPQLPNQMLSGNPCFERLSPSVSSLSKSSSGSSKSIKGDADDSPRIPRVSDFTHNGCNVDVYVKWGNSTEELGKLICIVQISKAATLAQLRKTIIPHIPYVNRNFSFIMFGDTGGEVGKEIEGSIRVGSLPDCLGRKGCRLACLRPPRRIKLSLPPEKLTCPSPQNENQLPQDSRSANKKKTSKPAPSFKNRPSDKMTFMDKARAVYFKELASNVLNGT